ncbi:MAG: insulinase family protein [Bacteroidales bacterium]|nr:insulinase family protein [Bacteroidales bacterium]
MTLNRKQKPDFKVVEKIDIPKPEKITLDNGIETFIIRSGSQDVLKLELIFNAGSWFQDKPLTASFANEMLIEGTQNLSSQEIAEKLDFYGAFIHTQPTKDFGNVSLYTLRKYLPETIQILDDIVKNPIFPEHELNTFIGKRKQDFQIDIGKVTTIARREFNQQLFGKNHPYAKKAELSDYENITRNDMLQFHAQSYNPNNCKIVISGKVLDSDLNQLNKTIGNTIWKNSEIREFGKNDINPITNYESIHKKPDAKQSAIRLGTMIVNKDHPDYLKLNLVNTLLGGFFGSRLMKTIREEKGYTYGINSVLVSLKNASYFVILSEVRSEITKNAISDILLEIKKLRTSEVKLDELNLIKNYMLGHLLRSFDGIFETSSNIRALIDLNLDIDYYRKSIETIKTITPSEINHLTNKYLHEETLIKTIVGNY